MQTEVGRLLANQALQKLPEFWSESRFNNNRNGKRESTPKYLAGFFENHFDEYNSRPYQIFTTIAFNNLYDFHEDPRVKKIARMLLDYSKIRLREEDEKRITFDISFFFSFAFVYPVNKIIVTAFTAIQTNGFRRFGVFRRQPKYICDTRDPTLLAGCRSWFGDAEAERLSILLGNHVFLQTLNNQFPTWFGDVGQAWVIKRKSFKFTASLAGEDFDFFFFFVAILRCQILRVPDCLFELRSARYSCDHRNPKG
jgi:hypothetical protein